MKRIKIFEDGLKAEVIFLLRLQSSLGDRFSVEKTQDEFAPVDYIVTRDGVLICYLELKSRFENLDGYDSLMVGSIKLQNIEKLKTKTLIIWDGVGTLYFTEYCSKFLNTNKTKINGSMVSFIKKKYCYCSYDLLISSITE